MNSSLVEPRKDEDTLASPSVRISAPPSGSRSISHPASATASDHKVNLTTSSTTDGKSARCNSEGSPVLPSIRAILGQHDIGNSSSHSLAIAEESESEHERLNDLSEHNSFNELINPRVAPATKMTPYGGFSRPTITKMLSLQNIFNQAKWLAQPSKRANATVIKAVHSAEASGAICEARWVGTPAIPSDNLPKTVINEISKALSADYRCEAVFPDDLTFQGAYNSFCKQILWPTLHYQIPDDAKSKAFEDHSWGFYKALNQLIADKVIEAYCAEKNGNDPEHPDNMIWVQDYHLFLVPQLVRQKLPEAKIGFFLHVAFPLSEVFRCFAQRDELLKGMLGANCITFQSEEYVRHFLQTTNRLLLADTTEYGVTYKGNSIMLNAIPAGIDAKELECEVMSEGVMQWRKLISERYRGLKLVLSRDAIDKIRGIKQKLLAFEKFLVKNPEFINKVVLIQICMGNEIDADYEDEVMRVVTRINGLAENIAIQPVVMLRREIEFDQYVALECEADSFVVSSMCEGLNLTCHEFIIATGKKHSPLVLSEFTGSASLLSCEGKGALLVNPWDVKRFGETIKALLMMLPEEKEERWQNCHEKVLKNDSKHWVLSCFASINQAWENNKRHGSTNLIPLDSKEFESFYQQLNPDGTRLFIFNFETSSAGLIPNELNPNNLVGSKDASTEPARLAMLLSHLLDNKNNQVYLSSFLTRADLDRLYRTFPRFGLIAENGGYIKFVGAKEWKTLVDDSLLKLWIPLVANLIESKVERLPGSYYEVEDVSVRFHAGTSFTDDPERSLLAMGDCMQHINELFQEKDGVHAILIGNLVVVQQNQLAIKAISYLTAYYNQEKDLIAPEALAESFHVQSMPPSAAVTPAAMTPSTSFSDIPRSEFPFALSFKKREVTKSGLTGVFIVGGTTPIDEPCYAYAESLPKLDKCEHILTVVIRGTDTFLRTNASHVVDGKNQVLAVITNAKSLAEHA